MENKIDYLRFSLTDRCNLNCIYCTPLQKSQFLSHDEILSYEEITKVVALFVKAGIRKLRLTGGEPLTKRNITELITMLKGIKGLEDLSMTTNGVYLEGLAESLKESGLDRINISIDTLKKEKFKRITGFDYFDNVWHGIEKALKAGLTPVKLNVILMKGINDDEISDFARLTLDFPLVIRFIELFPTNKRSVKFAGSSIKNEEVKKRITGDFGIMERVTNVKGNGPAQYCKIKDSKGSIGFISSYSKNFCGKCNRIRIDCAGRVSPCLFSKPAYDLRHLLRNAQDDEALLEIIKDIFEIKPKFKKDTIHKPQLEMSSIGG